MTEKSHVWEPLRDHCPAPDWLRIENLVSTGVPDINGCLRGVEAWVESKIVHGNTIVFQPMQPAWLLKRMNAGGRVFVLARKDDTLLLYGGLGLRVLLQSARQRKDRTLAADYRTASPLFTTAKPIDWKGLLTWLFEVPNLYIANQKQQSERKAA